MTEIEWQFNGKKFNFAQLKSGNFPGLLTPFEKVSLDFGRAWINGANDFSVHTSGSTGIPKKITLHRGQMEASARLTERALGLQAGYTALLCLDASHIAGQMMLVRSFVTGMNIVAVEPSANPWDHIANGLPIDFTALVPYQMHTILNSPSAKEKLNELKTVIIGGAPADEKLKLSVGSLKCKVFATYGMTETISHIALQKLNGADRQDYFQVLPGISIQTDQQGCLTIAANYLGPGKIVTHDLIEILSPHQFKWLGRLDNVINTGGVKVIPEKIEREVEHIFQELGLQNRFFISGIEDPSLGSKVVLIVEGVQWDDALTQRIYKSLAGRLSRYEIPKEIRRLYRFVETDTQKINRKATLEL